MITEDKGNHQSIWSFHFTHVFLLDKNSTSLNYLLFRNEYPDWESNLPKLIQSLGKKKKKVKATDVDDNVDSEVVSGEESDHDSEDNDDDEDAVQENDDADESDTKKVIDSNDNESVSDQEMKSENASNDDSDEDKGDDDLFVASLKQAISSNKRMDSKNSKAKPLKKQIKESSEGEAVIKMLDLSSMNKDQDWSVTPKEQSLEAPLVSKRSSFFMGGESEDEVMMETGFLDFNGCLKDMVGPWMLPLSC